jgi:predicted nucleotidyltransferase component of viral defense system
MIDLKEISLDWINKVVKEHGDADKILVEKVIRALLLVEGLAKQELQFVFKGGTALMLLMNSTKRLSIDIDIILPQVPENMEALLDTVVTEQGFIRKELQHRKAHSKIKKEHYKFFYTPLYKSKAEEESILLDILFEDVNYLNVIQVPIQSDFIPLIAKPVLVYVPCLEDILGDKLTAFAPNTTGIPYFKSEDSMSMEIIKQLYDIGNLLDVVNNIEIIKATFMRFAVTELSYRDIRNFNEADVIEDIYQTSLCIATRGSDGKGDFDQLQLGIQRVGRFIFSENYYLEKAIVNASKAAYLAMLIKCNAGRIEKFSNPLDLKNWVITMPMNTRLNRLKKSNPEAFFYWYKTYELSILKG